MGLTSVIYATTDPAVAGAVAAAALLPLLTELRLGQQFSPRSHTQSFDLRGCKSEEGLGTGRHCRNYLGRYNAKVVQLFKDDFFSSLDLTILLLLDNVMWTDRFLFALLLRIS